MRILHTADWHLNDRLGRIDRTDDLRRAVERIAQYCHSERVEVLIVAGDLFSELARPEALRETIRHWQEVFARFLEHGGTILATTGNHDNENFCQTLTHAMSLAAPTVGRLGEVVPPGRLYLAADPTLIRLPSRQGFPVQFILMPYPTPTHYLVGSSGQKYATPDDKNRLLVRAFEQQLGALKAHPKFDPALRSVMIAHVNVFGCETGPSLFRLAANEDVVVADTGFHAPFDYVALGHIHKPQYLTHPHVRYSGSIEKMDLGEQHDTKGVVLFELGETGRVGELVTLPLPSTPIYELLIANPAEDLPRLKVEYADAERDLVNLHIRYTAGEHNLEEVLRELERMFPRWYARDWVETSRLGPTLVAGEADQHQSFEATVREYLRQELVHHTEEEQQQLLRLAEELMQD